MAKSLKEALLEQMATLQERGLAPGELPPEQDEQPSYAHYGEDSDRRGFGGDGDADGRRGGRGRTQQRPRAAGGRPGPGPAPRMREQRELREPRRERREGREAREGRDLPPDLVGLPTPPPPRPMGPPRQFGPPNRMGPGSGPGPNQGPGQGQFPGPGGPRPAPRTDMLRRNAERIQREQNDRGDVGKLLAGYAGEEIDEAGMETFFAQLAVETGALPPLHVVLEALRTAGNAKPAEVAHQVRLHYRRSRARVAPQPVAVG